MAKPATSSCGLGDALAVIGGKWRSTMIWALHARPLRFGELRRATPGISEKVLMEELRGLEAVGVVHRASFDGRPRRVEYSLTAIGAELNQAVHTLAEWGRRHAASQGLHNAKSGSPESPRSSRSGARLAGNLAASN